MNLCTNAAQAMEEKGGVLTIALHSADFKEPQLINNTSIGPGEYIKISVQDTGSGIDPTIIDRIFDPYFTTKDAGKGSGMGLAVVHGIVQHHDGVITMDSKKGVGSTISVYFPKVKIVANAEIQQPQATPTGNEHLLIVDDEKKIVEMLQKRLERLGYKVTAMTSSEDALSTFSSDPNNFDLVITDQTMPQLSGDQLSQKMVSIRPDIPIILFTGYSAKIDELRAQKMGIRKFIMKPFSKNEIAVAIRDVLDKNKDSK